MKNVNLFILIGLSATILLSCSPKDEVILLSSLDTEVEALMLTASNGKGKFFYELPESTDFGKIPQDPKNQLTAAKVELGKYLFHETALGQNPKKEIAFQSYSCASCHHAKAGFQACVAQGIGEGGKGFGSNGEKRVMNDLYKLNEIDVQPVKSPSALNIAYQNIILWNGQFGAKGQNIGTETNWTKGTPKEVNNLGFEGIETQALAGREVHRLVIDKILMSNIPTYKKLYTEAFGAESLNDKDKLKFNGSLAIAAYERTLLANKSPFQQWIKGNINAMTTQEKEGAKVFFGKGQCFSCHNGPSLANMEFYAIGMKDLENGNYGISVVHNVSPSNPEHKGRGGFTGRDEDMFKFKVPQLYNLKDSPYYGHGSSFTTIEALLKYKNVASAENSKVPTNKLSEKFKPLNLDKNEIVNLTAFIKDGLRDPDLNRYIPKNLPSGLAFPNNDQQSRIDLGF